MRPTWFRWLPLLLLLLAPLPAQAQLEAGRAALLKGEWEEAERLLNAAPEAERAQAALALVELHRLTGKYDEAARLAEQAAGREETRAAGLHLLAEIEIETGRYDLAIPRLTAAAAADGDDLRLRFLLGLAYHQTGQLEEAEAQFQPLVDAHGGGRIEADDAVRLTDAALAYRALERWRDANRAFQAAVRADPNYLRANLEWGDLFLFKYNPGDARQSLEEVLEINPHHPRALTSLAHLRLEQGYNVPLALQLTGDALEQNPRYPEAFLVRARIQLDNAEFEAAEESARQALETNPNHLRAFAMLAASRFLQDDDEGFQSWRERAFQVNPRHADFFPFIAALAERHHRYAECIELNRQALAIDETHPVALYSLGVALLRTNQEEEGLAALQKAWDRDPFNVRNYNLLNLFERTIPRQYETVEREPFRFRWHEQDGEVVGPQVEHLMRRAWDAFTEKYDFIPKTPMTLEMYRARDDFSVRTMGLPDLGAQGVCFGEMVIAISPAAGEANWAQVLWHETAHVFHLQLSRNRVPRWFTEGLAEYEANVARPEWKREHGREIFLSLRRGDLWTVQELNAAFTRPDRPNGVVMAYHQASLVIHYLVERHGFPKLAEALQLYGEGKQNEEVLRAITGQSLAEIDSGFRRWLEETRYPYYANGLLPDFDYLAEHLDDVLTAVEAAPTADNLAELAVALFGRREPVAALGAADRALEAEEGHALARYVRALALHQTDRKPEAKTELEAVLAAGHDGFGVRMNLALMESEAGDLEAAERHLQEAKQWDPDRAEPYQRLAELYTRQERAEEAIRELAGICAIREHSLDAARTLFQRLLAASDPELVAEYAPLALNIQPADPFVLQQHGTALVRLERFAEAVPVLEGGVAAAERKATLRGLLALAYLETGEQEKARAAAEETLLEDPSHPEAREVMRRLGGDREGALSR